LSSGTSSGMQSIMEKSRFSRQVDTLHQGADYLTKGLAREAFEWIHKINQGW
jgi:hypothetical protein